MPFQNVQFTGGQTKGPGFYQVTATPANITLENWAYWADNSQGITIKDCSGSGSPSFTINPPVHGTIDGSASPVVMNVQNESLTFVPAIQTGTTNGLAWCIQ
jgi:hypothetical protein